MCFEMVEDKGQEVGVYIGFRCLSVLLLTTDPRTI